MSLLEVRHVSKFFGGLAALTDISFVCNKGEILGVIGPNGAGKTTLFNVINGFYGPSNGDVLLQGREDIRSEAAQGMRPGDCAHLPGCKTAPEDDGA